MASKIYTFDRDEQMSYFLIWNKPLRRTISKNYLNVRTVNVNSIIVIQRGGVDNVRSEKNKTNKNNKLQEKEGRKS